MYDMVYYSTLCGPAALLGGPAIRRPAAALNATGSDPAAVRPRAGRTALGAYTYLLRHRVQPHRRADLAANRPRAEAGVISAADTFGLFPSWAAPTCGSPGCAGHRGLDDPAGRGRRRSAKRCGMRSGMG
ncbi:hypothetical protein GCM10027162_54980 [Streptomyces incanus]